LKNQPTQSQCPLCGSHNAVHFHADKQREYDRCPVCLLVFVPKRFHLNAEQEKSFYDLHENNPNDEGYRKFLSRLFDPLKERLNIGDRGLDFGSGPGPTLSLMFDEVGFNTAIYDIYYAPDTAVLQQTYQFITATEVVEHLSQPSVVLEQLWEMLEPGGWLGLMTKLVLDKTAFACWHYKNDPTHISFFSRKSLCWLANKWAVKPMFIGSDVVLLQKPK